MVKSYEITTGFNIVIDKPWRKKKGSPMQVVLEVDPITNEPTKVQEEVRFEPSDGPITKSYLPTHAAFDWLIEKGVLVEAEEVEETEDMEVTDG